MSSYQCNDGITKHANWRYCLFKANIKIINLIMIKGDKIILKSHIRYFNNEHFYINKISTRMGLYNAFVT